MEPYLHSPHTPSWRGTGLKKAPVILCSSLEVRYRVSRPYKTTGKIILVFNALENGTIFTLKFS